MKLFGCYLKRHAGGIIIFILFTAIFAGAFALYRLPVEAVLYPAALCALAGIIFILLDYRRALIRHKELIRISKLAAKLITSLPEPDSFIEADYQLVIENLKKRSGAP